MKRLIVNADDFGLSHGVNRGVVAAVQNGIVRSTSVMVNMPGFEDAVALAHTLPGLGTGLHLNLTYGRPVLPVAQVASLVNDEGVYTKDIERLLQCGLTGEMQAEFQAQFERFVAAGLHLTHIDTHHHLHKSPRVLELVVSMAGRAGVPIRCLDENALLNLGMVPRARFVNYFGDEDAVERLLAVIRSLPDGATEIPCHPGYVDDELRSLSTLTSTRERELNALTDPRVIQAIADCGIMLASYATM